MERNCRKLDVRALLILGTRRGSFCTTRCCLSCHIAAPVAAKQAIKTAAVVAWTQRSDICPAESTVAEEAAALVLSARFCHCRGCGRA
eukprot:scaffold965_cov158-Amphora_coffeaeformis.AAC.15